MAQIPQRSSIIVEEDEIFDPMSSYKNSLLEDEVRPTSNTEVEGEVPPGYIAEETDDEDSVEEVSEQPQASDVEGSVKETSEQPQEEPQEESAGDGGVEVIAQDAMCKCTMGKKPGKMNVVCQFKVYCNGGSKLVATTQEKNMLSLSFGSCSAKNNAPCIPNVTWQNYYDDVQIIRSLKILTKESKGICSTGGGQIEFQTSGQTQSVSTQDITGVDRESLKSENPLLRAEDEPFETSSSAEYEKMLREIAETMRREMENPMVILEETIEVIRGKVDKNAGIVPVKYPVSKKNGVVKQPKGTLCSFLATKKGVLTWKVRDDTMKVIHQADGAGTISVRFPKYGRYVIEAYGNTSTVKDNTKTEDIEHDSKKYFNTLIVEVAPNEIILEANKEKWYKGGKVEIKAKKLFADQPPALQGLHFEVAQGGIAVGADKAEIIATTTGCIVTFKEKGSYVVTAQRMQDIDVKPTKGITIEDLSVIEVTANGDKTHKTCVGKTIEAKAKLNYPEAGESDIKWQIDFKPVSGTGWTKKEKPTPDMFKEAGTYALYAYVNTKPSNAQATVSLNHPTLTKFHWENKNGQVITKFGYKEEIIVRLQFDYADGEEMLYKFYHRIGQSNGKYTDKLLNEQKSKVQGNKDWWRLDSVFFSVLKQRLKTGDLIYITITPTNSQTKLINKTQHHPYIVYTSKEAITGIGWYADEKCETPLQTATYGNIVFIRVASRNLSGRKMNIFIYRHGKKFMRSVWVKDQSKLSREAAKEHLLESKEATVDANGLSVFKISTTSAWESYDGNDSYSAIAAEKENNGAMGTAQKFDIDRNLSYMRFVTEKAPSVFGDFTLTMVYQMGGANKTDNCICEERVRAYMRMLRLGEGTKGDSGYTKLFGGGDFTQAPHNKNMSDHPKIDILWYYDKKTKKNVYSSAAGAYQVMKYTWTDSNMVNKRKRYGIKDFTKESQDKFCIVLFKDKRKGMLDLILQGEIEEATNKYGSWEWASLPPGRYGQPIKSMSEALSLYENYYAEEIKGQTDLYLKKGFLKDFGVMCQCKGTQSMEIVNNTVGNYSIDKAVAAINKNALSKSIGYCAKYVRMAIESGGLSTAGRPESATDYDKYLPKLGFTQINEVNYVPMKGDICVTKDFKGDKNHPHGHISMYNGSQWVSDFTQRDIWAGGDYRKHKPQNIIFRWTKK